MDFFSQVRFAKERIILREIGQFADTLNIPIHVTGGYIRDFLLKYPSKDIDLIIEQGNAVEFTQKLRDYFKIEKGYEISKLSVFPHYGTAQFRIDEIDIEIVRARKESYSEETFKPEIVEGTLRDDIFRRDFTINTLAITLNPSRTQEIIDLTNLGLQDIKNRIIRTPKDPMITFYDDPTRIFRAIRFASKYNFRLEKKTRHVIKEFFVDHSIEIPTLQERIRKFNIVPIERIRDELNKILIQDNPSLYISLMKELEILRFILPGLDLCFYVKQNPKYHKHDVGRHTLEVLDNIRKKDLTTRLAAVFHDYGKIDRTFIDEHGEIHHYRHEESGLPEVEMRRLKYPNKIIANVSLMIKMHMRITLNMSKKGIRRFIRDASGIMDELLDLIVADTESHAYAVPSQFYEIIKEIRSYDTQEILMLQTLKSPLTGHDIIKLLKYPSPQTTKDWHKIYGIKIGQIQRMIVNAIVLGEIENTKDAASQYLTRLPRGFLYDNSK